MPRHVGWFRRPRGQFEFQNEGAKLLWLGLFLLVFTFTARETWREANYFFRGRTTSADVVRTFVDLVPSGRTIKRQRVVEYRFDDAGQSRHERDFLSESWNIDPNKPLSIEYIPDSLRTSRVAGHRSYYSVLIFLVACTALVLALRKLWKIASAETAPTCHHPKRRRPSPNTPSPPDEGSTFQPTDENSRA